MYKPRFYDEENHYLLCDSSWDIEECLKYARMHSFNVCFTDTGVAHLANILLDFKLAGFSVDVLGVEQEAPDGTKLSPKPIIMFELKNRLLNKEGVYKNHKEDNGKTVTLKLTSEEMEKVYEEQEYIYCRNRIIRHLDDCFCNKEFLCSVVDPYQRERQISHIFNNADYLVEKFSNDEKMMSELTDEVLRTIDKADFRSRAVRNTIIEYLPYYIQEYFKTLEEY